MSFERFLSAYEAASIPTRSSVLMKVRARVQTEGDDWEAVLAYVAHHAASPERAALAAEYVNLIGYDPFADDPSLTVEDVRQTLAEYKVEAGL